MIHPHPRPAELIASSLDRPLTVGERQEIERHLLDCGSCRLLEHQLRADAAALSVPVRVTPPQAIQAAIERQVAIPALDPGLVRAIRIALVAASVLLMIVVLAIGVALLQPRPTTPMETREPEPAGLHQSEGTW
jgi:anti-sigma factor RsiW